MDSNSRLFVTALRDACNRALEDGRCGEQTSHIEQIEVVDSGSPIMLRVKCFGCYSPEESERTYSLGVYSTMDMVAAYMAGRALYDLKMEDLKCPQNKEPSTG